MKKIIIITGIVIMCFGMSGCQFLDDLQAAKELSSKINSLYEENEKLRERLSENDKILREYIASSVIFHNLLSPQYAEFSPSEKGYSILAAPGYGIFSISVKDIKEFSTGSKIDIEIVNLLAVSTTNIDIKFEYSNELVEPIDGYVSNNFDNFKNKTERISNIEPGTSKIIDLRIPEYKPSELKYLKASATVGGISYKKGK